MACLCLAFFANLSPAQPYNHTHSLSHCQLSEAHVKVSTTFCHLKAHIIKRQAASAKLKPNAKKYHAKEEPNETLNDSLPHTHTRTHARTHSCHTWRHTCAPYNMWHPLRQCRKSHVNKSCSGGNKSGNTSLTEDAPARIPLNGSQNWRSLAFDGRQIWGCCLRTWGRFENWGHVVTIICVATTPSS